MLYYKSDTVLTVDADSNGWTNYAAEWLISETGINIAAMMRDVALGNFFIQRRDRARDRFLRTNEARVQANFKQMMGDD